MSESGVMDASATRLDLRGIPESEQPLALIAQLSEMAPGTTLELHASESPDFLLRRVNVRLRRITSYNVCYTKLLRAHRSAQGAGFCACGCHPHGARRRGRRARRHAYGHDLASRLAFEELLDLLEPGLGARAVTRGVLLRDRLELAQQLFLRNNFV